MGLTSGFAAPGVVAGACGSKGNSGTAAEPALNGLPEPIAGATGFGNDGSEGSAGTAATCGGWLGVEPRRGFESSGETAVLAGGSTAGSTGANCGCVNCGGANAGGEPSAGGTKSGTGLEATGGATPAGGVVLGASGAAGAVVGGQTGKLSVLAGSTNAGDDGRCAKWSGDSADCSEEGASAAVARGGVVSANWLRSSELQPNTQLTAQTGIKKYHRDMRLPRFLASSALESTINLYRAVGGLRRAA